MANAALALVLGLRLASASPGIPEVARESGAPPRALPPAIRAALAESSLRVTLDGRARARFWFARKIAASQARAPGTSAIERERLNFSIAPGALVAAVELLLPWTDAKGQTVPRGLYELRYGSQPVMKEHRGTSVFRDFLVLVPPGAVRRGAADSMALAVAGRRVSGTAHPAVLALYPAAPVASPRVTRPGGERRVLEVRAAGLSLGLMIEGQEAGQSSQGVGKNEVSPPPTMRD